VSRAAAAAIVALLLWGCATAPTDRYYSLDLSPKPVELERNDLILKVRTLESAEIYRQTRIVRRPGPNEVTYYDLHRWAAPLEQLVTEGIIEVFRARSSYGQVLPITAPTPADHYLDGEILAFEERIDPSGQVAVVRLRLRLTDAKSGELLGEEVVASECPASERAVRVTVAGLSHCLEKCATMAARSLAP
jgi:ABC-type uncharacterized transport system auxiliary subunit